VKGQISYVMKPMTMIAVIILLVFLLQSLYLNRGKETQAEKKLDIVGTGTNILLILANSKDCLAYDYQQTMEKANILDAAKLDNFMNDYQGIEPECARNYDFGWRAEVKELGEPGIAKVWNFGAGGFSSGKSLNNEVNFWIPVAIRYSENDIRLGKMDIRLVDGELEKLAGFLDWSCKMGQINRMTSSSTDIKTSYPAAYNSQENKICVGESCRKLQCRLRYFDGFDSDGIHTLNVEFKQPDILLVGG